MLKRKNAFTLAELLITLTVCATLASLLLPAIAYIRPDKKKVLFKKAYYVAERMVYELVNDEDFYPTEGETVGLANTVRASYLGFEYGGENDADAKSKFCKLFGRKVNITGEKEQLNGPPPPYCDASHSKPKATGIAGTPGAYKNPSFVTTDGIAWYMPNSKFDKTTGTTAEIIYVDVNNKTEPNCMYKKGTCDKPDIFRIYVEPDGKMYVDGVKESEYLKSNNSAR